MDRDVALLLQSMSLHGFMPFLFLGVQVQASGVDPGVTGVALQKLDADPGIGLMGDTGVAEPVGGSPPQLFSLVRVVGL